MTSPTRAEIELKFWSQVKRGGETECWLWTGGQMGGRADKRYGYFTDGRWTYYTHRFAYSLLVGPIPNGGHVLHSCDAPLCCNPAHLYLGTHKENMGDMYEKGRGRKARGEASGKSKLTANQALAIYRDPRPYHEIAAEHDVGITCVGNIKRGETWGHLTQHKAA